MVSARLGGSDPASNNRLRIAITKARAANMPRDTIERAIKKGAGELEGQTFEDLLYEIYAPGGIGILCLALTDKKTRTTPEIKSMVTKYHGSLAEANAVSRLFSRCGQIIVEKSSIGEDELMEIVLEAGADDMTTGDNVYEIITAPENYAAVSEKLAEKKIESLDSGIRYIPLEGTEKMISDEETAFKIQKFLDSLEEHDEVQEVYHNMVLSDDLQTKMSV